MPIRIGKSKPLDEIVKLEFSKYERERAVAQDANKPKVQLEEVREALQTARQQKRSIVAAGCREKALEKLQAKKQKRALNLAPAPETVVARARR